MDRLLFPITGEKIRSIGRGRDREEEEEKERKEETRPKPWALFFEGEGQLRG